MSRSCKTTRPASNPAEEFRLQLEQTCTIVLDELKEKPDSFKALFLAGFVAELAEGVLPIPSALESAVAELHQLQKTMGQHAYWRTARDEGLASLMAGFWWSFNKARWLDRRVALVFGRRLARLLTHPAHLYYFQRTGAAIGGSDYKDLFEESIRRIDPQFAGKKDQLKIDAMALQLDPPFDRRHGLYAEFYPDGHLKKLGVKKNGVLAGPLLELDSIPGAGRFRHEGKSGGSGFLTDETYRDGATHGTFFSPWHDGEEYSEKKDWLIWVLERAETVKEYAPPKTKEKSASAHKKRARR